VPTAPCCRNTNRREVVTLTIRVPQGRDDKPVRKGRMPRLEVQPFVVWPLRLPRSAGEGAPRLRSFVPEGPRLLDLTWTLTMDPFAETASSRRPSRHPGGSEPALRRWVESTHCLTNPSRDPQRARHEVVHRMAAAHWHEGCNAADRLPAQCDGRSHTE
jgi:hypothetical protein